MPQWKPIVGLAFEPEPFDIYVKQLNWTSWRPSFVAVHNTANPDLAMRPNGFTRRHMDYLADYYKGKGWSAGPHLFIDDRQIWVFTPLTTTGRHSPGWNQTALGVEMLGDYNKDKFDSGRGLLVRQHTVCALASIHGALGLDPATIRLHKEDPLTDHDCPGKAVSKKAIIAEVTQRLADHYKADHIPDEPHPD